MILIRTSKNIQDSYIEFQDIFQLEASFKIVIEQPNCLWQLVRVFFSLIFKHVGPRSLMKSISTLYPSLDLFSFLGTILQYLANSLIFRSNS